MPDLSQMSDEELMAIANSQSMTDLSHLSDEDLYRVAGIQQEPTNLFSRLSQNYSANKQKALETYTPEIAANEARGATPFETNLAATAKLGAMPIGNTILDTAGHYAKELYNLTPERFQTSMKQTGQVVGNSQFGDMARNIIQNIGEGYSQFKEAAPRMAQGLESVVDLGGVVTPLKQMATPVVGVGVNQVGKATLGKLERMATPVSNIKNIDLKGASSQIYENLKNSNVIFPEDLSNNFAKSINSNVAKPMKNGKYSAAGADLNKILDSYTGFEGQKLTPSDALEIDRNITADKVKAWVSGDKTLGSTLANIQNDLRSNIYEMGATGQDFQDAISSYAAASKLDELNYIEEIAANSDNKATALKNAYNGLYKQIVKKGGMGWTPDEISAIKHASKTGLVTGALKTIGSRLGPFIAAGAGFGAGGTPGAMVAGSIDALVAKSAREGAASLQAARANKVYSAVAKRPVVGKLLKEQAKPTIKNKMAQSLLEKVKKE